MGEGNLSTLKRKWLIIILWTGQDRHPNKNLFLKAGSLRRARGRPVLKHKAFTQIGRQEGFFRREMDVLFWKKILAGTLPLFHPYAITNSPLVEAGWAGRTGTHQYHFDPRMQLLDSLLDSLKPWSMARTSELSYRARPLEWTRSCQAAKQARLLPSN